MDLGKDVHRAIAKLAAGQFGLVTRQQLLSIDVQPTTIKRLVASDRLEVVHRGVFRLPGYPLAWDQRLLAAQFVGGPGSAISFDAGAMFWDIDRIRTDRPHITVVHAQKVNPDGFVVHRTRLFAPGDIIRRGPLRVTSPFRTIIDLAGALSDDDLEDALDDAIRQRLVSPRALLRRLDIRGRRGVPGAGRLAKLLDLRIGTRPKSEQTPEPLPPRIGTLKTPRAYRGIRRLQ